MACFDAGARPLKGTVVVLPGRNECIEKYFETVRDLSDRGFATAVLDWRGQGGSDRLIRDAQRGHVKSFFRLHQGPRPVLRGGRAARLPRSLLCARALDRIAHRASRIAFDGQPRAAHGAGRAALRLRRPALLDEDGPANDNRRLLPRSRRDVWRLGTAAARNRAVRKQQADHGCGALHGAIACSTRPIRSSRSAGRRWPG